MEILEKAMEENNRSRRIGMGERSYWYVLTETAGLNQQEVSKERIVCWTGYSSNRVGNVILITK
uniref:Uncharacterized protein n=1 Tax=Candidatus Kentrum sp. LFY TaxID=2126342 RepID=A0A450WY51_9GAMM|nr:MAG: hypothetical protein BECKLFY1418C_GA0070996_11082 [Candidatus Kentron sp. LFY]